MYKNKEIERSMKGTKNKDVKKNLDRQISAVTPQALHMLHRLKQVHQQGSTVHTASGHVTHKIKVD